MAGRIGSVRDALRHADFRRLLGIRLVSQTADGLIQAALVASLAFSPDRATTAAGFALASAIVIVPFSILGPFAGVFIDRWSRRRIMIVAPLLRAAPAFLVLLNPDRRAVLFYAGALWVTSVNRFFLATAQAVVPRLVPTEDLLAANSVATVGGTVALLVGVFTGGLVSESFGNGTIVTLAATAWLVASAIAVTIRSDLRPHQLPEAPELLRHQIVRVVVEFTEGIKHIVRTPRAIGPIASISVDQMGQGLVLVLALVVFKERFGEGVGSFSWLIGAGGVGVFIGLATVGRLDRRFARDRIVAWSFVFGGISLLAVSLFLDRWTVLITSFAIGLSFAWKKIPVDTMVQEAVPDGLRGRVFAVYDVAYNLSRLFAAVLAIVLLPTIGENGSAALIGVVFLLWAPVLPRWIRGKPEVRLRFHDGARAEAWPRAVVWGGVEEPVEVLHSALVERDGEQFRTFRLAMADGTTIDVSSHEQGGAWTIDRELIE
ncbi:MAG: MFS transporter [Actinomycetota bacterium]